MLGMLLVALVSASADFPTLIGIPPTPLGQCALDFLRPKYFKLTSALAAEPVGGQYGKGLPGGDDDYAPSLMAASGEITSNPASTKFQDGELVEVSKLFAWVKGEPPTDEVSIKLRSVLLHSVTRGSGSLQHQSQERVSALVKVFGGDCETLQANLAKHLTKVLPEDVEKARAANPSGVIVDEIREGMTPADVERIMGVPERKASVGGKVTYFYARMKVVFRDGKVADVE